MRDLNEINHYRMRNEQVLRQYGSYGDERCGAFALPAKQGRQLLFCLASADLGWDHVSVSLPHRYPTWAEMDFVKRKFFRADEVAMQLHPTESNHISFHPFRLHLWRPTNGATIPLPPKMMVA